MGWGCTCCRVGVGIPEIEQREEGGYKKRSEEEKSKTAMFALLFDLEDYATTYRATRDAYLKAANELKLATGPYKAARDAYVAATATYTKSLYE